jgi:LuxR family transcriptional regulator, maltose regulon positive regulatory protein
MDRRAEEGQGLSGDMTSTRRSGRPGKSRDEAGPLAEILPSKLHRPLIRPETAYRSSLIEQLAREDSHPTVSVAAPPGFGKTTLLAQWLEHSGQAVAWVSVDERDDDPKVLLRYVSRPLDDGRSD